MLNSFTTELNSCTTDNTRTGRLPEVFWKRNPARQEQGGEQNATLVFLNGITILITTTVISSYYKL